MPFSKENVKGHGLISKQTT